MTLKFKDWYEARYACPYPGLPHESSHEVLKRMAEGFAEYVDYVTAKKDTP